MAGINNKNTTLFTGNTQFNLRFPLLRIFRSLFALTLFLIPWFPLYSQTINVISDLQFPDTVSSASFQRIVIAPDDSGAAVFDATGPANQFAYVKVKENIVQIRTSSGKKLLVGCFTYGGSLIPLPLGALGIFDANGNLHNMRIGATGFIKYKQKTGHYSGTLTLQVTYH